MITDINSVENAPDDIAQGKRRLWRFLGLYIVISAIFALCLRLLAGPEVTGSYEFHGTIEMCSAMVGMAAGLSCFMYFFGLKNPFYLAVGIGFFIAGTEDLVHAIASYECLSGVKSACGMFIIQGSYIEGGMLLPILIIAAPLAEKHIRQIVHQKRIAIILTLIAVAVGGGCNALTFLVRIPEPPFPLSLIPRPADVATSGILFTIAFVVVCRRLLQRRDIFSGVLLASILLNLYGELCQFFSKHVFDSLFEAAHWADLAGALMPLIGIAFQELAEIRVSAREMAERRKAELALREAHDLLEQKVEERTRELKLAQSHLVMQEKMASVGQLAAGMAHELNNPVSFVSTNLGTLRDDISAFKEVVAAYKGLFEKLNEKGAIRGEIEKVRAIEEEVALERVLGHIDKLFAESKEGLRRVNEIISSMRDFSRAYDPSRFTLFDINKGIRDTLTIARNSYKYHAEVKTELGNIPEIMCVPDQIGRVFLNIVVNAAEAISEQKRETLGLISIRTYSDEANVYCEIGDDGPGIPSDVQRRLFEPFFTTKEPGKGTGLGLSISWDIVNSKHGGSLTVRNREGGGTVFIIRLPVRPPEPGKGAK
jgi:signal transduction histidine kinase